MQGVQRHLGAVRVTPSVWLAAVLGLVTHLLVSTMGSLVAQLVRRWMVRRKRAAELRWRACVMAAREQVSTSTAEYVDTGAHARSDGRVVRLLRRGHHDLALPCRRLPR